MKDNVYISFVVSDILRNEKRQSRGGFVFILVECWHPVAIISVLCILIRPRGLPIDYLLQDKLERHGFKVSCGQRPDRLLVGKINMYTVQICTKSSICGTRWTGVKGRTSSFQINLKSSITYRPLLFEKDLKYWGSNLWSYLKGQSTPYRGQCDRE